MGRGLVVFWDLGSVALTLFICERNPMVGQTARCHWQAGCENEASQLMVLFADDPFVALAGMI